MVQNLRIPYQICGCLISLTNETSQINCWHKNASIWVFRNASHLIGIATNVLLPLKITHVCILCILLAVDSFRIRTRRRRGDVFYHTRVPPTREVTRTSDRRCSSNASILRKASKIGKQERRKAENKPSTTNNYTINLYEQNETKHSSNYSTFVSRTTSSQVKSSQISFIAWKIRKIGEASADTAATETYYMKGVL